MLNSVEYKEFDSKRFFGVEIEFGDSGFSRNQISDIISKKTHKRVKTAKGWAESKNNSYWHVKHDSTCGEDVAAFPQWSKPLGWEVASYKAAGKKDIFHIAEVAEFLKSQGALVNYNCGFHIHVDVSDFSEDRVSSILANWIKVENIFFNMVPERRSNSSYCKRWRDSLNFKKVNSLVREIQTSPDIFWDIMKPTDKRIHNNEQKKFSLNLVNYIRNLKSRKTLELRLPEGTLDGWSIVNWTIMFINFLEYNSGFPSNLDEVKNVDEFLEVIGMGRGNGFCIYGQDLSQTRSWALSRIQRFAQNTHLWKDSLDVWKNINIQNN